MDARNNDFDFDFTPIGQAIKKARTSQGMTREQLARIVDYDPRHLQAIENEGQYPSLELFIQLVTMFNISVDEYIFPQKLPNISQDLISVLLDDQVVRLRFLVIVIQKQYIQKFLSNHGLPVQILLLHIS